MVEIITDLKKFEKSNIIFLPFLNNPPSSYDTVYTVLKQPQDASKAQSCTLATFDQPLYYKA